MCEVSSTANAHATFMIPIQPSLPPAQGFLSCADAWQGPSRPTSIDWAHATAKPRLAAAHTPTHTIAQAHTRNRPPKFSRPLAVAPHLDMNLDTQQGKGVNQCQGPMPVWQRPAVLCPGGTAASNFSPSFTHTVNPTTGRQRLHPTDSPAHPETQPCSR